MEIGHQELRERYQNLSTDELLQIKISSDLNDLAMSLLEEELSKRDVTPDDIEYAEKTEVFLAAYRESTGKVIYSRIRRDVIVLVLLALMAIYFEFLQ
jgi:hypothetical protein